MYIEDEIRACLEKYGMIKFLEESDTSFLFNAPDNLSLVVQTRLRNFGFHYDANLKKWIRGKGFHFSNYDPHVSKGIQWL